MTNRWLLNFYGVALFTLPWVGVGVLRLATGRDWGWGLQPSWLFLALAMGWTILTRMRDGSLGRDLGILGGQRIPRWWIWGATGVGVALVLSAAGLWMAPSGVPAQEAWARYGKQIIQLGIMVAFVAWPAAWTRGVERWNWTIAVLVAGAVFQSVYGLVQAVAYYQPFPLFGWLDNMATSNPSILSGSRDLYLDGVMHTIPRLRGIMCEPLYLGSYLLFVLPLTLVSPWPRRWKGAAFLALVLLLAATWSRGAWLAAGTALFLGVILFRVRTGNGGGGHADYRWWTRPILWGGLTVIALLVLAGLLGWSGWRLPFERIGQTFNREDWSNLTRLYSMQAGWRAFLLNPPVGIGWGQFGFHFPLLVDPLGLQSQFSWPVVNNFPLKILCETGLAGGVVFLLLMVRLVLGLIRGLRQAATEEQRLRILALAVAFAGVWIQLLTFSQYNLPHIWVALGLLLAALAEGESKEGGRIA